MSQENQFTNKMQSQSNLALQNYIQNKQNFQKDAVIAAAWELEKRNQGNEHSVKVIEEIYDAQNTNEVKNNKDEASLQFTDDPDAIEIYNPKFVFAFGVFFSVFGGSILMAMNLSRIGKKKEAKLSVLTGLIYTILQIGVLNLLDTNMLTLPVCFLGMYLLDSLFWKRNVLAELKYRKRNVWGPLIIGLIITIPFIFLIIMTAVNGNY